MPSLLLLAAGLALLAMKGIVTIDRGVCIPLAAAWLIAVALQIYTQRAEDGMDFRILPTAFFLSMLGVLAIGRLKADVFTAQIHWLIVGLLICSGIVLLRRRLLEFIHYPYVLGLACLLVLSLSMLFGTEIGGSRNWIVFSSFAVQPSEFGKILLILFLASFLAEHGEILENPKHQILGIRIPALRLIAPLLLIWSIAILMFVVQRDLGSALIFFGIAVSMTYMATGRKTYAILAFLVFFSAAWISYHAFSHVAVRFDIWLDPWQDPDGRAYQIVQSLLAFASGGIWGTGFGDGQATAIPAVHTDFIFAALAEEFGLIGSILIMLIYALLFYQSIRIALQESDATKMLLVAGIAISMFLQAFIIIAGVSKFLPLTGITLPFVSYGGSSMTSSFILVGLLISLSKQENQHG
ncbi:FtsW/RodA/SpoVE family cell cycle protein [Selenomonas sp. TAMA-11512]|nr:FtsW/RodA/SpoVE family cell cycle protein [Selenomonas sp. TAMA-11512]